MDKAQVVTQPVSLANKPVPSQSPFPSKVGSMEGGATVAAAALTADDFKPLGVGLSHSENHKEKALPQPDSRENRLEGNKGSSSSYRGPGQNRVEDSRDKGLVNRGRGQTLIEVQVWSSKKISMIKCWVEEKTVVRK